LERNVTHYPFDTKTAVACLYVKSNQMRRDLAGPLPSLAWLDNNCFVNAAVHATAGLALWRATEQASENEEEQDNVWIGPRRQVGGGAESGEEKEEASDGEASGYARRGGALCLCELCGSRLVFYNPEAPETPDQPPAPADQRPDLGALGASSAASASPASSTSVWNHVAYVDIFVT